MDSHICKLCSRRFLNGRALGGHMKAHLSFLPRPSTTTTTTTLSSTASDDGDVPAIYALRENPRKSIKVSDPDFSFSASRTTPAPLVDVRDGESEAESRDRGSGSPRGRKRRLRRIGGGVDSPEAEPVSSVSDTSPEEDVAICLMMLCRDDVGINRARKVMRNGVGVGVDSATEAQKKLHQCEVCKKCFRSSQALGGHRIIHRKKVVVAKEKIERQSLESNRGLDPDHDYNHHGRGDESRRIFECPFCGKVFGSGQALGGHKRSHMMGGPPGGSSSSAFVVVVVGNCKKITSAKNTDDNNACNSRIDLNLPAPTEDEDVCSVISDDEGGRTN